MSMTGEADGRGNGWPLLSRLYPILDVETLERHGVGLGDAASQLLAAGVRLVQLRDKRGGPQEVLRRAATVAEVFRGSGARLILNDRADLAVLAEWDGVHVGHLDLPVDAARRVVGGERWVGVSTHNEEQVRAAEASSAEYVAIGPVFGTASKSDTEPVVGLDGVRRARALTGKPLVAIGGITVANARSVIEAGADSVAVIGALLAGGPEGAGAAAAAFLRVLRL